MLTELQLQGFKCFEDLSLQLRPLTVLSGANGGGKSTIIQALVLLAQSLTRQEWGNTLLLEGPDLALGSAIDVLHQRSKRRGLGLSVATADQRIRWRFDARDRRAPSLELREAFIDEAPQVLREPLRWLLPHDLGARSPVITALRRVSWITAERIGPRELLPLAGPPSSAQVGARGELAAALLYWRDSDEVRPRLRIPDVAPTLLHQVRARMQQVFPGCDLRVSAVDGASAISLRLKSNAWSDFQRPQNVGFGLTQLFPILVAVLSAGEGECLLIENPEVHLHPWAQQYVGSLLTEAAASGVQVIVETHSDHVLNGVRLAARRMGAAATVALHFFGLDAHGDPLRPASPQLDADGRLDHWPEGFFDQLDLALSELL